MRERKVEMIRGVFCIMTIVYDHGKVHEDTFLTVILYSLHNDAHAFFHLSRVVLLGKEATVEALEMLLTS